MLVVVQLTNGDYGVYDTDTQRVLWTKPEATFDDASRALDLIEIGYPPEMI